ncbi:MAG: glycoside hydrolase family 3 protein [Lewinellaceae bacterium]|nr:glycoside hydrolase family 3 protein [Lewinellaceae bacterium]
MRKILPPLSTIRAYLKRFLSFLLVFLCFHFTACALPPLSEQPGYPAGSKLLLLHADDPGMFNYYEKGLKEENIQLTTWRELGARWRKKRLKKKIGQMLLLGFRGMSVGASSPIVQHIEAGRVGSVILFDYDVMKKEAARNIKSPTQVKALVDSLQAYAGTPLLVAIDQEGGRVLRLKPKYGFPAIPSAFYLGQLNNLDSTRYNAELNARTMASLGINLNFAPVVDLNTERESGVIGRLERSFSDNPEIVTQQAQAVIKAHLANGVIPVLKHFPGHGSARNDSHKGLTDVTDTWSETELEPYRRIIGQGYEGTVMTAHVFNQRIDDKYPATLSKKAISILRDSIGYDGVIFSDDMQMEAIASEYGLEEAIILCINAGVDVLCFGNNLGYDEEIPEKFQAIVLKAVEEGRIRPERIEEAYERVMRLKKQMGSKN